MDAAVSVANLRKEFRVKAKRRTFANLWQRKTTQAPSAKAKVFSAVDGITFQIAPGERVAFVGPNGAGKSTTIKMLSGILAPTSGDVSVLGMIPTSERSTLAYSIAAVFGQRSQLWYHLPVRDSWQLLGRIYGIPAKIHQQRLDTLCQKFGVGALADRPVKQLSLGERMRCELIGCFLHAPKVLFLDEPTIGLDVEAKGLMRDLVKDMCTKEGCTLLLTSHDTGDMESVCDRVIIINQGRVVFDGAVAALRRRYVTQKILAVNTYDRDVNWESVALPILERAAHSAKFAVDVQTTNLQEAMTQVLAAAKIVDLVVEDPPMEETIKKIYAATAMSTGA